MNGRIFYGVSGWRYAPWRGVFYPRGLAQKRELWYASRAFSSLEINGTFYSLQSAASFAAWEAEAPPGFVFSVKGPRFVTHMLKLRGCGPALANFFGSGVLALGEKLGPFLWQLPPQFGFREERLREFFAVLPRTTHEARALARKAQRLEPSFPRAMPDRPLRHAIEIRHDTFLNPDFVALLKEEGIALVLADSGGLYPYLEDVTADFLYLRLHGPKELYSSGYDEESLRWWADRISAWAGGGEPRDAMKISSSPPARRARDVFVYFDNDAKVNAPFDAARLAELLGLGREGAAA
jgi:uncharacterized protein YecE (DUF72 family)